MVSSRISVERWGLTSAPGLAQLPDSFTRARWLDSCLAAAGSWFLKTHTHGGGESFCVLLKGEETCSTRGLRCNATSVLSLALQPSPWQGCGEREECLGSEYGCDFLSLGNWGLLRPYSKKEKSFCKHVWVLCCTSADFFFLEIVVVIICGYAAQPSFAFSSPCCRTHPSS